MLAYIEDLLAREEPVLFPPVLHMGKLIPNDLEQCVEGLRKPFVAFFQCQVCQHRIEIDRSSSATKGIVAVKIEPISANEGCTRLWKSEIQFDGIFEGLGVQPPFGGGLKICV